MNNYLKRFFIFLAIAVNIVLWQNCAPSFVSNNSQNQDSLGTDSGVIPDISSAPVDPNSKLKFINPKYSRYINQSTDELQCSSIDSEIEQHLTSKLSRVELANTIKSILGLTIDARALYPRQTTDYNFESSNIVSIEDGLFLQLENIGDIVASEFADKLSTNVNWPCNYSLACYNKIKSELPFYLWRRPLSTDETQTISSLMYESESTTQGRKENIKNLVKFLMSSPQFVFKKHNVKTVVGTRSLELYELASKASFFLQSASPSFELLDKIRDNDIKNEEELLTYLESKLEDDKVIETFAYNFFGSWLKISEEAANTESFNGTKVSDLASAELDRVKNLIKTNQPLKAIIDGNAGLLTSKFFAYKTFHGAEDSAPVTRGTYVMANIACFQIPELSPATEAAINSVTGSADFPVNGNNLEKLDFHRQSANCAACHKYIDPLAVGLEHYDAYGNYRTKYPNGDDIKYNETLAGVNYSSPGEFTEILANTVDYKACFSGNIHKSFVTTAGDDFKPCFNKAIFSEGNETGMKQMIVNILRSDHFLKAKKPVYSALASANTSESPTLPEAILDAENQGETADREPADTSGECTVSGSNVTNAIDNFNRLCAGRERADCDNPNGTWLCSTKSNPTQATVQ